MNDDGRAFPGVDTIGVRATVGSDRLAADCLIGEGLTEATADAWIAACETRASEDGLERG